MITVKYGRLAWVRKDDMDFNEISRLRNMFTLYSDRNTDYGSDAPVIEAYEENTEYFGFPRQAIHQALGNDVQIEDCTLLKKPIKINIKTPPWPAQVEPVEQAVAKLKAMGGCIINAPCGTGKTNMGLYVAAELQQPTMILVNKTFLQDQWRDRIKAITGSEPGIVRQDKCEFKRKKFVIGMIQSLASKDYPEELYQHFGLIVVDECLEENTLINTPEGLRPIGKLTIGDYVQAPKGFVKIINTKRTVKDAVKIILKSGKSFIMSEDHPVFQKPTNVHHRVSIQEKENIQPIIKCTQLYKWKTAYEPITDWEAYLVGLFLGDGHLEKNGARMKFAFRKHKEETIALYKKVATKLDIELSISENSRGDITVRIPRYYSDHLKTLYSLPIGKKSNTVEIPSILRRNKDLLRGIFDTDGYSDPERVAIQLTSRKCVEQIKEDLEFFNISPTPIKVCRKGNNTPAHRLELFGTERNKFNEQIMFNLSYKNKPQSLYCPKTYLDTYLLTDSIVSMLYVGKQSLVDIEVDSEDHLFLADGYIMHNCHHVSCVTYDSVIRNFPAKYRLGLSASPRRSDGLECLFYWHLGGLVTAETKERMKGKVYQFSMKSGINQHRYTWGRRINFAKMITDLTKIDIRQNFLETEIMKMVKSGRKILVLSDRKDHLKDFAARFDKGGFDNYGFYIGAMKEKDLQTSAQRQVVLGTFSMSCIATDQPWINYFTGEKTTFKDFIKSEQVVITTNAKTAYDTQPSVRAITGSKACLKIRAEQTTIEVSTDHKVMTQRGWAEASELTTDDYLTSPKQLSISTKALPLAEDEMWLMGILIGDGSLSQYKKGVLRLTAADKEIVSKVNKVLYQHNMELRYTGRYNYRIRTIGGGVKKNRPKTKTWLRQQVERYNLGKTAKNKCLPESFMRASFSKVKHLLAGLIDSDGSVSCTGIAAFSTSSEKLAHQYKFLMWRLGLNCSIVKYEGWNKCCKCRECMYTVSLAKAQLHDFLKTIPLVLTRKLQNPENTPHWFRKSTVAPSERMPQKFVKILKRELKSRKILQEDAIKYLATKNISGSWLRGRVKEGCRKSFQLLMKKYKISCPDLDFAIANIWKKIKDIEAVGVKEVADATVANTHNYLVGDVVVHNSEGLDVPDLDTVVLTTPKSDIEQAVGRILRQVDGKKDPLVVDIIDTTPILMSMGKKRAKFYANISNIDFELNQIQV